MQTDSDERIRVHVLREILEGTAVETGEGFFAALVEHLAKALGTKCAWVTQWHRDERRLEAVSLWIEDRHVSDYEYFVDGTPCESVIEQREFVLVPECVIELFPEDTDLPRLGAVSYMGLPLLDTDGSVLGNLAVIDDAPLTKDANKLAVFEIFADRAAAELQRLRRDRALRERERKLSRLIDHAMDAIVELDGELRIRQFNRAAEDAFRCSADEALGKEFEAFVTPAALERLRAWTRELERRPEGRQSTWIAEGLTAKRSDGSTFEAEATWSRFEFDGRPFHTLILRDVEDRLEAERRICVLTEEANYLREEIEALQGFDNIVGESRALKRLLADVERVADSDTTVLITGETGTGKELIARAVHSHSRRRDRPLVKVNCAAIPTHLQESEFFGHEKGAFTGATERREGRFQLADGGTIFLDEVGELPVDLQAKLLRVLQEGEYEPVGSSTTRSVDVRVIAATNRDLEAMVRAGTFRADLFYRLHVFPLEVPALRDRGDDIVLLAETFVRLLSKRHGRAAHPLREIDRIRLRKYDWPGNVRELENVIERALITSRDGFLNLARALPDDELQLLRELSSDARKDPVTAWHEPDAILTVAEIEEIERANLVRALEASNWKISGAGGAADRLGLHPNTLSSRMKSLGVTRPPKS